MPFKRDEKPGLRKLDSTSEYHGILVKEGLRDQTILKEIRILGKKRTAQWTLLKVGVDHDKINEILQAVQNNLISVGTVPYYAHFYRDEELIVVFPEGTFHVTPDRRTWGEVVSYGTSKGIPAREMDIRPCRVEDETY